MTPKDIRHMVSMVRAIRAGKWTDELPAWTKHAIPHTVAGHPKVLQEMAFEGSCVLRAVQTAEAFILLAHSSGTPFDETTFLQDCGFVPK